MVTMLTRICEQGQWIIRTNNNTDTRDLIDELSHKYGVKGNILAIGDSAKAHAALNSEYFRSIKDISTQIGVNIDRCETGEFEHFVVVQGDGKRLFYPDNNFDAVIQQLFFVNKN